jgi:hypothetical protein
VVCWGVGAGVVGAVGAGVADGSEKVSRMLAAPLATLVIFERSYSARREAPPSSEYRKT